MLHSPLYANAVMRSSNAVMTSTRVNASRRPSSAAMAGWTSGTPKPIPVALLRATAPVGDTPITRRGAKLERAISLWKKRALYSESNRHDARPFHLPTSPRVPSGANFRQRTTDQSVFCGQRAFALRLSEMDGFYTR